MKKILLVCMMFLLMLTSACGNVETTPNQIASSEPEPGTDEAIIPTNTSEHCLIDRIKLDSETEKFFYGTWKVEKHLGFANSWNDASEYPTGQKFIGDELIVKKDFFSSKGLKHYKKYQYEQQNPIYQFSAICNNPTAFYRLYKIDIPDLHENDVVKAIVINDPSTEMRIPAGLSFFVVNNDRLILLSEATIFELKKVSD
ncbi:hypothetical protein [Brevibacillus gelatini]|uniref:Lipoprotein n=1 Tax=Brevibacillus gelatini TaxID=1655277 RepID=A0A3M8BEF9_9BACL|nr:hypothetical protein [Brevibacillus gelatini]RNB61722.1 hypothetical protein EDM57_01130 [Brevibacillus gelatini]